MPERSEFPKQVNGRFVKLQDLRYGENPHQRAAFYRDLAPAPGSLVTAKQLQGKELSYNNIADADAAWECVKGFDVPACVIVKHANPCGVAIAESARRGVREGVQDRSDLGLRRHHRLQPRGRSRLRRARREAVRRGADRAVVQRRGARRLRGEGERARPARSRCRPRARRGNALDVKRVGSGLLIQSADTHEIAASDLKVVTTKGRRAEQTSDLLFAWKVAKFVKSNAIVYCAGGMTLGVGAGQMSRLDSARIASIKAEARRLVARRLGGRERRVLPVSRRPRRRHRWRRVVRDPARRLDARRRGRSPPRTSAASRWSSPACAISATDDGRRRGGPEAAGLALAFIARLVTGAQGHWHGSAPKAEQRIYFANHQSHFDWVLIWAALPADLRAVTRPIAARDYWTSSPLKHWITREIFNAVYVSRQRAEPGQPGADEDPLEPLMEALRHGDSLVIFPEGTRGHAAEPASFKSGLYALAQAFPDVQLIPTWIDNVQRVMPKGEVVPVPILCAVVFGPPIALAPGEERRAFLDRARAAVIALRAVA